MNHYVTIKNVIEHLVKNKKKSETLEELSQALHVSSGHLQKVFTAWVGITPKQFTRYLSLDYAKDLLLQNKNMIETSVRSGLSGGGRLHDLFVAIEAMTPGEYQNQGENLVIRYSTFETKFGSCLVASTERGICNIFFFDEKEKAVEDLRSRWPKANILHKAEQFHAEVKNYFLGLDPKSKIKLHLRGTNFQIKVWEALLSIPEGKITSYGSIAQHVGTPKCSRAVGAAIGDNPVGYIIPCHRVLKSTGEISGYRWGVERKRAMLLYEALRNTKEIEP